MFAAGFGIVNIDLLYSGMPRIPNEGEEIYAQDFSMQLGGGYVATLITLGRLSVPCKMATFLGNDLFSDFARRKLETYGQNPCNLYQGEGMPLNVTTAIVTQEERTFVSYRGDTGITSEMRERFYEMCRGAKIVFLDPAFWEECAQLQKEGATLLYDVGWYDDLSPETYGHLLQLADYYVPNSREAMKMTGTDTPEDAAMAMTKWFDRVVVKTDRSGCLIGENGIMHKIFALPNVQAVDATGAGDAFLAGFAYGIFHERSLADCAMLGNITGAACVQGMGCLTSYVTEEALLQTLATHGNASQ